MECTKDILKKRRDRGDLPDMIEYYKEKVRKGKDSLLQVFGIYKNERKRIFVD